MRKKKLLSSLLVIAMMMWMMPMKVFGADTITLSVSPSTVEAHPGDEIKFTFKMGEIQGFTNMDFKVQASQGLTLKDGSNKVNSAFKEAMGENGSASLKVNNGVPKFTAYAETTYSSNDESTLGELTYTVTGDVNSTATITLIDVAANAEETELQPTLTGATVNITPAPVEADGISILPSPLTLKKGNSGHITANVTPIGATNSVTWSVDPSSVATLTDDPTDMTGRNLKKIVTAEAVGTATITATTDNGKTATCTVTVVECTHDHKTHVDAQGATCTEPGHSEYDHCEECGQDIGREDYPALGHDWSTTYEYSDTQHWRVCTRNGSHEDRGDHTFGAATYTWSAGNSTCTASHTCTVCNKEVSETVDAEPSTTPATCTEAEKTTYTATFTKTGFTPQTKEVTVGEALGHNWGAPTYIWSEDNSTCTATRTCKRDASHKETETVNSTYETTGSCGEPGTITYTAMFANTAFVPQTKDVETDVLPHSWVEETVKEATDDLLGLKQDKCTRCGEYKDDEGSLYINEGTSPDRYPDDERYKGAYISDYIKSMRELPLEASDSKYLGEKEVKIIVQDPLGVFAGEQFSVSVEGITDDLGNDYDANYTVERAYKAKVILSQGGEQISGQLPNYVRILMEIPEDSSIDWDDEEIQGLRINPEEDTEYVERIEYRVYDEDGNFVKVVDKNYKPEAGETVRKFIAIWTNHFSDYALIDPDKTASDTTNGNGEPSYNVSADEKNDTTKKGGLKTGETIEMYVTFSMILFSAAGILLISLKKRKKAE